MRSTLILISFPGSYIMIGIIGKFISTAINQCMCSQLQFHIFQRIIDNFRFQPHTRQRISFHHSTGILVIFKKTDIIQFYRQLSYTFRINLVISLTYFLLHLCPDRCSCYEKHHQTTCPSNISAVFHFTIYQRDCISFSRL